MDRFLRLAALLQEAKARFLVIGVWGRQLLREMGSKKSGTIAGCFGWRTSSPVARLSHIVASKSKANRPKDRLFLETHAEALRRLIEGN